MDIGTAIREREANAGKNNSGVYDPTRESNATGSSRHRKEKKIEDELKHRLEHVKVCREYSRLCVRLLHESVFLYGYDRKITQPFEASLPVMKEWLLKEHVHLLRCQDILLDTEKMKHLVQDKVSLNSTVIAALKEDHTLKHISTEDPGWQDAPIKQMNTVASIKHLISNVHDIDESIPESEEVDSSDVRHSVRSKKMQTAALTAGMAGKLNRVMAVKRQSMILNVGANATFNAPGLSESKVSKKNNHKVAMISSKISKSNIPLADRKDDLAVQLENKEGGMAVMSVSNFSEFVPAAVARSIKRNAHSFGDQGYWEEQLRQYIGDNIGSEENMLTLERLCLHLTGKRFKGIALESAVSKLFGALSHEEDASEVDQPSVHKTNLIPNTLFAEVMRYLVTMQPIKRTAELSRMHRAMVSGTFGSHEVKQATSSDGADSVEQTLLSADHNKKAIAHAITGHWFFTEEQNRVSDERTTFLRRLLTSHRDRVLSLIREGASTVDPDLVKRFWSNVVSVVSKVFPQVSPKSPGSAVGIDALLFRDIICAGLDLMQNDRPPDHAHHRNSPSSSHRVSTKDTHFFHSQAHASRLVRVNEEGFHMYRPKNA